MDNGKKSVHILIVDDDEDDFYFVCGLIRSLPETKNWVIDWCCTYKEALDFICQKKYDIYFIDYFLGGKTGLDLLREGVLKNCHEPIILLTGKGNQPIDIEAMRSGAADYLVKSELTQEKLERGIRYALENARTLKALRINEQKYRGIFEQSRDAFFLLDSDLHFIAVNHATNLLLEYSKEELLSISLTDLMADELQALKLAKNFQEGGEINDMEIELVCKSGNEKIFLFSSSVINLEGEEPLIQGLLHEVTGLRAAEKSALMVEKMAIAGRLVQTIAHEIRNPLTNITLSAVQLQKTEHLQSLEQYSDIILRNSSRIDNIISQLIYSSRQPDITLLPVLLQTVLDEAITAATDRIVLKNISLQVKYPVEVITIMADKSRLVTAFLNVITNSLEAMEDHSGRLIISVHLFAAHCEVRITDNGCGISEENQKKLFEPYYTSKRNGVGLGLTATLNIFQSHSAKIDITSLEDTGTTFSVVIPVAGKLYNIN